MKIVLCRNLAKLQYPALAWVPGTRSIVNLAKIVEIGQNSAIYFHVLLLWVKLPPFLLEPHLAARFAYAFGFRCSDA
jgi:hypothetical protein